MADKHLISPQNRLQWSWLQNYCLALQNNVAKLGKRHGIWFIFFPWLNTLGLDSAFTMVRSRTATDLAVLWLHYLKIKATSTYRFCHPNSEVIRNSAIFLNRLSKHSLWGFFNRVVLSTFVIAHIFGSPIFLMLSEQISHFPARSCIHPI